MNTFPDSVQITGLGARTPLGDSMDANWRAVLGRRTAISPVDRFDLGGIACQKGGVITDADNASGGLATTFALDALREAIDQSGADVRRLGLLTGSNFGESDRIPCDHAEIARRAAAALGLGCPVASAVPSPPCHFRARRAPRHSPSPPTGSPAVGSRASPSSASTPSPSAPGAVSAPCGPWRATPS